MQYGDSNNPYLPTSTTDDRGNTSTIQYNSQGLPTAVTDALNHTTTTAYNNNGTVASVTDGNGHVTASAYNGAGLLTQVTPPTPLGPTTYSYDSYNRVTASTDGKGQSTGYTYDAADQLLASAYADGSSMQYTYDAAGRRLTSSGELTGSQTGSQELLTNGGFEGSAPWQGASGWDKLGAAHGGSYYAELQGVFGTTQSIYQTVNVPSSYSKLTFQYWLRVPPLKSASCSSFSAKITTTSGNPILSVANPCPAGFTSGWAQESVDLTLALAAYRGQQVRVMFSVYSAGASATLDVDDASLASGTDKTTETYNTLSQVTQEQRAFGPTTNMSWDNAGNLLSKTTDGFGTSYTYTADNQVSRVSDNNGIEATFSYDQDGNRTQQVYPNGVTQNTAFNAAGQLTRIWATNSSNATLTSFTYSYTNPATNQSSGVPFSVTDVNGKSTSYQYDANTQLTQATQKDSGGSTITSYGYAYDAVGNKTLQNLNGQSTTFTYNAADLVTQTSGAISLTYSWDANGNETSTSSGTSLTYNSANQTTSITPSGGQKVEMGYSGSGQAQRVTAGQSTYQYDVGGLVKAISPSATTTYNNDPGGGVMTERVGNSSYFYLTDGNGSVVGLTDSSGNLVNQYSYDLQGNTTSSSGSAPNDFRYAGVQLDGQTGYYPASSSGYYDPRVGVVTMSEDPDTKGLTGPGAGPLPDGAPVIPPVVLLQQKVKAEEIAGCKYKWWMGSADLKQHFKDHGAELGFGEHESQMYLDGAAALLCMPVDGFYILGYETGSRLVRYDCGDEGPHAIPAFAAGNTKTEMIITYYAADETYYGVDYRDNMHKKNISWCYGHRGSLPLNYDFGASAAYNL